MTLPNTQQGLFLAHSAGKIPWGSLNLSLHSTECSIWWFHSHEFAFPVLFTFCHAFPFYSTMIIKTKALTSIVTCVIPSCISLVRWWSVLGMGFPSGALAPSPDAEGGPVGVGTLQRWSGHGVGVELAAESWSIRTTRRWSIRIWDNIIPVGLLTKSL